MTLRVIEVARTKPATLGDAFKAASLYWEAKGPSSRMMPLRCARVMSLAGLTAGLPLAGLTPSHGTLILTALASNKTGAGCRALSKGSQVAYYGAFLRMLALSGVSTVAWPKAGVPPRRVREPMREEDLGRLRDWMRGRGYLETVHLALLIEATGMRVEVEALNRHAVEPLAGAIKVTGKGGHERIIPVGTGQGVVTLMASARKVPYHTHLRRWNEGVAALGIATRLPTPHSVRHLYATKAWERSKDLRLVQELMGHSDPATTMGYIGVDAESLRRAAGC